MRQGHETRPLKGAPAYKGALHLFLDVSEKSQEARSIPVLSAVYKLALLVLNRPYSIANSLPQVTRSQSSTKQKFSKMSSFGNNTQYSRYHQISSNRHHTSTGSSHNPTHTAGRAASSAASCTVDQAYHGLGQGFLRELNKAGEPQQTSATACIPPEVMSAINNPK